MSEGSPGKGATDDLMWRVVSREALIAGHKEDGRTVYRREGKAKLVAAATAPGASVAKVARDHGLNANQLHVWIRLSRRQSPYKGESLRRAAKVVEGLERAAIARAANIPEAAPAVRLVPVVMFQSASAPQSGPGEALVNPSAPASPTSPQGSKQSKLVIEIGSARIVVEGEQVDGNALSAVIACLRDTQSQ